MKTIVKLILMILTCSNAMSQENKILLDSVFNKTGGVINDTLKIKGVQIDFFKYVYNKPAIGKEIANKAIILSEKGAFPYAISRSYILRGIYYDIKGDVDSALIDYDKAFSIAKASDDLQGMASVYNNKGLIEWNVENYDKALEYYLKSLSLFEKINYASGIGSS